MGERTQNFTLEALIARDRAVAAAEKALANATMKRELLEERVLEAGKHGKPKKDKVTGKESNRGFVERALSKMKPDKLPCKKTPGVVSLMSGIDYYFDLIYIYMYIYIYVCIYTYIYIY
jgi:hypothetical protein